MKKIRTSVSSEFKTVVLITGASSGIGYEFCRLFARNGYHLAIVARNKKKLEAIASGLRKEYGVDVFSFPCDLADETAPVELDRRLKQKKLLVDILINNAGFGVYGPFSETSVEKELAMIRVNIVSLTHLTKLILPGMIGRKSGKILNVASTTAFQPGPLMAVYYASKAYVLSFSEALAAETCETGVTISALCPGATRTQFQQRAGIGQLRFLNSFLVMDAATVADAGYHGLMKGTRVIIPGFSNKISSQAHRFLSRKLLTTIVLKIQKEWKSRP